MRFRHGSFGLGLLLATVAGGAPLHAQVVGGPPPGEEAGLVDRIVAVVGDSAIFMSQVQEEMLLLAAQTPIPEDPQEYREAMRGVLDQLVNLQLILQEAATDSTLAPSDEEIEARVQETVDQVRSRFPSAAEFQAALRADGLSPNSYRETLRRRIREQQVQQLFLERNLATGATVAVTEAEMREIFEAQRGQLQQRPEILSLSQIIMRPTAADDAWAVVEAKADSLIQLLRNGADFAQLARENSDDAGNADQGGELPWFRRGNMVREFEDAAFSLPDNVISDPVRTQYGVHIIRIDRRRPGELKARHILLMPETGANDIDRTMERATDVVARARAGEDFSALQEEYGDPGESIDFTVSREQVNGELPAGYSTALSGVQSGDVVGPFQIQLGPSQAVAIVKVQELREAGEITFEDVESQIRQRLQRQKQIERLFDSLRSRTYVDIRF